MSRPEEPRVNVADRLAAVAAERPDEIAVVSYDCDLFCDAQVLRLDASGESIADFDPACEYRYEAVSFGYLNHEADTLARGLIAMGVGPGKRIALLVRPGIEFVTLVFALLRTGATMVLVDAGLGRKNLVRCLASTEPDGFVAIPLGHAMRLIKRRHFPKAKLNVTVGPRRWFWGGETYKSLRKLGAQHSPSPTGGGARGGGDPGTRFTPSPNPSPVPGEGNQAKPATDHWPLTTASAPAAIVFTSGSTGPPKGVLYTHQTFETQCSMIQAEYDIRPGDIDLACFPLFGLFNVACGVTTVLPEMDFSRPASCDPKNLIAAANQWKVNQAFASPAVWDRLSRHCEQTGDTIPTLKKVLSCGAPVPAKVMRRTLKCVHSDARMHTPYGATEALPIATIEAREVLDETAAKTDEGAGVCVGRKFGSRQQAEGSRQHDGEPSTPVVGGTTNPFDWRIIRITDDPVATIDDTEELPPGEIGELIVRGPQVSQRYLETEPRPSGSDQATPTHNSKAKITDGDTIWHRMGDVGYFDEEGRFWYCGRKSQRVVTSEGTLYTECIEAQVNALPRVGRSALVAAATGGGFTASVAIEIGYTTDEALELLDDGVLGHTGLSAVQQRELGESFAGHPQLRGLIPIVYAGSLPTDIRHNSKIRREELAVWAEKQLRKRKSLVTHSGR